MPMVGNEHRPPFLRVHHKLTLTVTHNTTQTLSNNQKKQKKRTANGKTTLQITEHLSPCVYTLTYFDLQLLLDTNFTCVVSHIESITMCCCYGSVRPARGVGRGLAIGCVVRFPFLFPNFERVAVVIFSCVG